MGLASRLGGPVSARQALALDRSHRADSAPYVRLHGGLKRGCVGGLVSPLPPGGSEVPMAALLSSPGRLGPTGELAFEFGVGSTEPTQRWAADHSSLRLEDVGPKNHSTHGPGPCRAISPVPYTSRKASLVNHAIVTSSFGSPTWIPTSPRCQPRSSRRSEPRTTGAAGGLDAPAPHAAPDAEGRPPSALRAWSRERDPRPGSRGRALARGRRGSGLIGLPHRCREAGSSRRE